MCGCIESINGMLAEHNTRLSQAITFGSAGSGSSLMLRTEQIETGRGKKKAANVFPSFCPFCGEAHRDPQ